MCAPFVFRILACAVAALFIPSVQAAGADQILGNARLPAIPGNAKDVRTNVWTGASAGLYAAMTMDRKTLDAYLAALPADVSHASPVPFELQIATPRGLPWFDPASLAAGDCYFRNGVRLGALERFRVFFEIGKPDDPIPVLIYYTWNFRG